MEPRVQGSRGTPREKMVVVVRAYQTHSLLQASLRWEQSTAAWSLCLFAMGGCSHGTNLWIEEYQPGKQLTSQRIARAWGTRSLEKSESMFASSTTSVLLVLF